MKTKAEHTLALLKRYRSLIRFVHPYECHHNRGSDCSCGAESAEAQLVKLVGPKKSPRKNDLK